MTIDVTELSAHLRYLLYVLRHKWFVLVECYKVGCVWRGLVHDLSKFMPSEWNAYVDSFYGGAWPDVDPTPAGLKSMGFHQRTKAEIERAFDHAWLLHQHRNPHHWQFWLLQNDEDGTYALPMPYAYVLEMVCDWRGAGRAQGHGDDLIPWYEKNRDKMILHQDTRIIVDKLVYGGGGER